MKVVVPIKFDKTVYKFDKKEMLKNLKKLNATGVALTLFELFETENSVKLLKEYKNFFEKNGLDVSLWVGGSLMHFTYGEYAKEFYGRVDVYGNKLENRFCPYDDKFVDFYCDKLKKYLSSGIKTVFFDDDFRLNIWAGSAQCFCDKHMEKYRKILGENITRDDFKDKILYGKPNKFRDVWLDGIRESLVHFAKRIRDTIDSVDKSIRCGICESWEFYMVPNLEKDIIETLAGKNESWVRMSGAPYFDNGFSVARSIEIERSLYEKTKLFSKDIYVEGDTYPHSRQYCSASALEMFDIATRALLPDANILKYSLCYYSSLSLEKGYVDATFNNRKLYNIVSDMFKNTRPEGYKIIENFEKIKLDTFSKDFVDETRLLFNCPSITVAERNSLPTKYSGQGPCIAIGANAHYLTDKEMKAGVVLDYKSACILMEKGIDVGIEKIPLGTNNIEDAYGVVSTCSTEKYQYDVKTGEYMYLFDGSFEKVAVKSTAEVLTEYVIKEIRVPFNRFRFPASYYYVNDKGYKFYVMLYDYEKNTNAKSVILNYVGQKYLVVAYEKLSGKPLPASLIKYPNLYLQACKSEKGMVVGLWNFSTDMLLNAEILLDENYTKVTFVNCKGKINNNKVVIKSLPAFTFCAFELIL